MAVPIAKELLRKGYVVPKDPIQKLNYNCIRRDEIRSKKTSIFYLLKKTQHLQVLNKVQHAWPLSLNATFVYLVHRVRVYFQLMLGIMMSLRTSMTHLDLLFQMS